jgi:hypothetical protein
MAVGPSARGVSEAALAQHRWPILIKTTSLLSSTRIGGVKPRDYVIAFGLLAVLGIVGVIWLLRAMP